MTIRTLAALSALLMPFAAAAETVTLSTEAAGATLHHATVDMSVYWTKGEGEKLDLVAYYAPKAAGSDAGRLQMALGNDDSVTFGLPGQVGQLYTFARDGNSVSVTTSSTATVQVAMN
ncbi:hypothetical protein [Sagittula salina]|uniref:Uncharacterized protein n=1 Tax=Sagittula salina TaxID=2820268 RepID=A0A940S023_9RHOB|nr:hypothetical protein [Sagittula salina]MBP0481716.1 hypothetical protein [Sagittula salina]